MKTKVSCPVLEAGLTQSCFLLNQQFLPISSLHWIISLSFCLFSYNGVCQVVLKLSITDVIVSQKGSNGDGKLHFFGRDYILLALFAQKHIFGQRYMFVRGNILHCMKRALKNQNKPMETTQCQNCFYQKGYQSSIGQTTMIFMLH